MHVKQQFQTIVCISAVCTILFILLPALVQYPWQQEALLLPVGINVTPINFMPNQIDTRYNVVQKENHTDTILSTDMTSSATSPNTSTNGNSKNRLSNELRRVKIDAFHLYHGGLRAHTHKMDFSKCYYYQNCEIVRNEIGSDGTVDADAILMQGNHMPSMKPRRRNRDQVLIYWTVESPQYLQQTSPASPFFIDYFNWTMTYRLDSDIPYLYGLVLPRDENVTVFLRQAERTGDFGHISKYQKYIDDVTANEPIGIEGKNYSAIYRKKDSMKSVVWLVSHCITASKREKYVDLMKPYLSIDIFGRCTNNAGNCPRSDPNCDTNIVDSYKFYLAFENSICEDYITEKAFKWYNKDIVLVVRGARQYKRYLPPNTYIDADDFKSAIDLAKYLRKLGSNEREYLNFLKKRDMYHGHQGSIMSQLAFCNLCYKLNDLEKYRNTVEDLSGWWRGRNNTICSKPKDI